MAKKAVISSLGSSASMKTLGTTLKTAFISNPLGWIALAGAAIFGVIKVFDHFTESVKESKDNLTEYQNEYQDAVSQIETLSSELDYVRSKIDEINRQGGAQI